MEETFIVDTSCICPKCKILLNPKTFSESYYNCLIKLSEDKLHITKVYRRVKCSEKVCSGNFEFYTDEFRSNAEYLSYITPKLTFHLQTDWVRKYVELSTKQNLSLEEILKFL